jgi:hypothetical protein
VLQIPAQRSRITASFSFGRGRAALRMDARRFSKWTAIMLCSVSSSLMVSLLIALLLQGAGPKPRIVMQNERVPLESVELALTFAEFSRADLIEVVQVGKQEETSVGISSIAIRNHVIQHRQKSYNLQTRFDRRPMTLSFRPADVRQESVVVVTIPQGVHITVSMDGETIRTLNFQGSLLIHEGRVDRGPKADALNVLYARIEKGELVDPVVPESNPKPHVINKDQPDLTYADVQVLRKLSSGSLLVVVFEATVTETGQVIEVHQTSQLPVRLPNELMKKIEDAAMRFSYEPYVVGGKAQPFTTSIAVELPR